MTGLTLLVLLVAEAPGPDDAISRAAHEALGPEASVVIRRVPALPNDEDALELEREAGAEAVAEIICAPPTVALHVHIARGLRWIDRELRFSRADAPAEEWRTVGFALASMIPDPQEVEADEAPAPPAAPKAAAAVAPREADRIQTQPPRPRRWAFDLGAVGRGPIRSDEGSGGGLLAVHWFFSDHFGVRASTALRTSEVEQGRNEARSYLFDGALGLAWRSDARPAPNTFSVGARADLILTEQQISRESRAEQPLDPDHTLHRVVPGADLVGEAVWSFIPQAAAFAGVGAQASLRTSPVRIDGNAVATIPLLSPVFEGGVRTSF